MKPTLQRQVDDLLDLRDRLADDYFGDTNRDRDEWLVDSHAIEVELDRLLTGRRGTPRARAMRISAAMSDHSDRRRAAERRARIEANRALPPARRSREAYRGWHLRDGREKRREEMAELDRKARAEGPFPDFEARMAAGLDDSAVIDSAATRIAGIRVRLSERRPAEPSAWDEWLAAPGEEGVTWTNADRLTWEELDAGVPCQGCGQPFRGTESEQRPGEPWSEYSTRLAAFDAPFRVSHGDHGHAWRIAGGPLHCRRCCAPHPISPRQLAELARIMAPPASPAPPPAPRVRYCGTCHQPKDEGHVCRFEDLPKRLQDVLLAVKVPDSPEVGR